MRRTCTHAPHSCIAYRAPSAGAGPLPVPEHARTRVPPSRPSHCGCTRFRSGPATHGVVRDDVWLYQYVLFESVPTVPSSSSPASALAFDFRVGRSEPGAPALLTATLCPDRGTAEPSCTPSHVLRAAQAPVHRMPHSPSPGGTSSPPRARAYPSAALLPSRGRCTRVRSGLATSGVRGDLLRRDLYVRVGVVSTVPCTSSIAAVCRSELLSAVVFSRMPGAWPMVARVCYSSVYF